MQPYVGIHNESAVRLLMIYASLVLCIALAGYAIPSKASPRNDQLLLSPQNIYTLPRTDVGQRLPDAHLFAYYVNTVRLFQQSARKEAVFWFYVGEIRYRIYLRVHPELPPDGDPALFDCLHQTIGTPINDWAGSDPDTWVQAMQRALDWDRQHDNGFTSKTTHANAWHVMRADLKQLVADVLANKSYIREQRKRLACRHAPYSAKARKLSLAPSFGID